MSFTWPWALFAVLAAPPLAWAWSRRFPGGRRRLGLLALVGLTLLLAATARPVATVSLPRLEGRLILAFDNSTSMLAEDASPTRIAAAQDLAHRLVDAQPSTVGIGVVSFRSGGVVLQEPTSRHELVRDSIDRLAPQGDTSLAQGIFTSLSAVIGEPIAITQEAIDAGDVTLLDIGWHEGSAVVVFTDGENRSGLDPRGVAELAANSGIRVFTVGVGEREGTLLEVDGFTIATALNERSLADIASVSEATYFPAAESDPAALASAIDDAIELKLTVRGEETEITALVGGAGMLLVLLVAALSVAWFGRAA
ncbi:MAG: VWA domain-containing protein [Actinomycetota bacterium]